MNTLFKSGCWVLLGLLPVIGGCGYFKNIRPEANMVPRMERPRMEPMVPVVASEDPASLEEALAIAIRQHPDLAAAQARVESARGRMIQAGLYPNPTFGPNFNELGSSENALGEAGARFIQQFVTNNKLAIAKAAAAHGVEVADWQTVTKYYEIVTKVRTNYFELLTAVREQDVLKDIVRVSQEAKRTVDSLIKAGALGVARPDLLRAEVELEQNVLKLQISQRRIDAARQNLQVAMGGSSVRLKRIEQNRGDLDRSPPEYDWQEMIAWMQMSSAELQAARAQIAQNERLLERANAEVCPNITATFIPYVAAAAHEYRTELFVTMPLPIFDRNQGNIYSARHDLSTAQSTERNVELLLTERLTIAYQRYLAARQQVATYKNTIVRKAMESLKLVEAGYKAQDRKYDYTAVLQAQQILFQASLSEIGAVGEMWRWVAELANILQQDSLRSDLPPPQINAAPAELPAMVLERASALPRGPAQGGAAPVVRVANLLPPVEE